MRVGANRSRTERLTFRPCAPVRRGSYQRSLPSLEPAPGSRDTTTGAPPAGQLLLFRHHPQVVPLSVVSRNVRAVHINTVPWTARSSHVITRQIGRGYLVRALPCRQNPLDVPRPRRTVALFGYCFGPLLPLLPSSVSVVVHHFLGDVFRVANRRSAAGPTVGATRPAFPTCPVGVVWTRAASTVTRN